MLMAQKGISASFFFVRILIGKMAVDVADRTLRYLLAYIIHRGCR